MLRFLKQQKQFLILLCGCLLIPFLLCLTLFYIGFSERNLSGLLNEEAFFPYIHLGGMFMLAWLIYILKELADRCESKLKTAPSLLLLAVLITSSLWIGWSSTDGLTATVHIMLAYGGFVWMNILFYAWARFYTAAVKIYVCLGFTAFILSVSLGYVSGISEVIYGAGCSVLLALCAAGKIKKAVSF